MNHNNLEFSRPIAVADLPERGKVMNMHATNEECAAIAKRALIPNVSKFELDAELKYLPQSKILHLTVKIRARYIQICVLSLEPFEQNSEFNFESECLDAEQIHDYMANLDAEDELSQDGLEPIINGHLDLGELAVQNFLVLLDPYPKKPGVSLNLTEATADADKIKPFSALKSLKNNI